MVRINGLIHAYRWFDFSDSYSHGLDPQIDQHIVWIHGLVYA